MVRKQPPLRLTLIGLIGLGGAALLWTARTSEAPEMNADGRQNDALVTTRYVPAFTPLKPAWVSVRALPKDIVFPGALHGKEELLGADGRPLFMSAVALPAGQFVTRTVVGEVNKEHGMSSVLAPGKVAVSFAVDSVHGAGGWVRPGDVIALLETSVQAGAQGRPVKTTRVLYPDLEVLAVDRNRLGEKAPEAAGDLPNAEGTTLTVLVTPAQAIALVSAREANVLTALLRALGDDLPWTL